jgi:hypothetical protein
LTFDNIREAGLFVYNELRRRYRNIPSARWINEGRNAVYNVLSNQDASDKFFYLKFEHKPYYAISRELETDHSNVNFKGAGVTINKAMYDMYVEPSEATVLYALPANIYHMSFAEFEQARVQVPHKQHWNGEWVLVAPLTSFKPWMPVKKVDSLDEYI